MDNGDWYDDQTGQIYPADQAGTPSQVHPGATIGAPTGSSAGPTASSQDEAMERLRRQIEEENRRRQEEERNKTPAPPTGGPDGGDDGDGGDTGGPTAGPTGSGGFGYLTEPFEGKAPGLTLSRFEAPPPFDYQDFQAPTADSMFADPSYQFRMGEGKRALEQSAAGRGVLRTGGTLKDLLNYGQQAASQEYGNIFDRAVQSHNMGLQQNLGEYATNYGVSRDVYDRLFSAEMAQGNRAWDSHLLDADLFERNRRRAGDFLFRGAELGASTI